MAYINEEAEDGPPAGAEDEIQGPVDEGARKRKQPHEGEEERKAGDNLSVDEAAEAPCTGVRLLQVVARDAGHDGGKGELGSSQEHTDDAVDGHGDCCAAVGAFPWPENMQCPTAAVEGKG